MSKTSVKQRINCFVQALKDLNPKAHHEITNPANGTKPEQDKWQTKNYWEK